MILAMNLRLQVTFVLGDIGSSQVLSGNAFNKGSKKSISNDFSHFAFRSHFSFETLDPHRSYQAILKRVFPMIKAILN